MKMPTFRLVRAITLVTALSMLTASVATAAVWTDQEDYAPGSVVTISGDNSNFAEGEGYLAGETVHVDVDGPADWTASCDAIADGAGAWSCQITLAPDPAVAVGEYQYTATGLDSGTTEAGTFTDGLFRLRAMFGSAPIAVTFPGGTGTTSSMVGYANSTCTAPTDKYHAGNLTTATTTAPYFTQVTTSTAALSSNKITAPATAVYLTTTYAFSSWSVVNSTGGTTSVNGSVLTTGTTGCFSGWNSASATYVQANYVLASAPTTTLLTALPVSPSETGTNVTFTAEVNVTSDSSNVTTGNVKFYDAAGAETCTTLSASTQIGADQALDGSGNASVSTTALSIATHTILACYQGATGFDPSGTSLSYTITTIATTTDLSALPASPQEYGTNVTFTAHVEDSGSNDLTVGDVRFYDAAAGATCAAPLGSTQIGTDQTLGSNGDASVSTAALEVATHDILACYLGTSTYAASDDTLSYTITLIDTDTTLTVDPTTQQYSDKVDLTADITPSDAPGSVQFSKSTTGCAGTFTDIGAPVAVVAGQAVLADQVIGDAAATDVCFKADFETSDSAHYDNSSDTGALTVTKEDATILYAGGNPAAAQVDSPGFGSWTGPLVLNISVKETTPDLAGTGTAAVGDISNAGLSVVLSNIGGGGNITLNCVASAVSGTGYAATRPFVCTSPGAIPLGAYEVQVNVTGDYYAADQYLDAFTVYDPSLGFATGGGWFMIGSDKVNFGFVTKYNKKNGSNPQGSFIAVRHYADGTIARLKSNSLTGLAITTYSNCGNAQLSGKSTFTWWDPTANFGLGGYVTSGNNLFSLSAWDCNQPGTGFDKIWLKGPSALTTPGSNGSLAYATVIGGGNIAVPHRAR
jgi:hypothetical protein